MRNAQAQPLRTCLHDRHLAAGAEMGAEDGWDVPVSYGDPAAECRALHERAAVMDVSPVGRIRIRGDGATDLLDHLCTADVARQEDDTAAYTLLCNERGGILDHAMVVRLERFWLLTCSPHRRPAVLEHLQAHAETFGAKVDDQTCKTAMLAVVGPGAPAILDAVLPERASAMGRGAAKLGSMMVARYVALRTGPTRLWSLEVMLPNLLAGQAWRFITHKAGRNALPPAGFAAREVLRIEAGLCRHGREIDETTNPATAGLTAAVCFDKDFLGAAAVRAALAAGPTRQRVGLLLPPAAPVPAFGAAVTHAGRPIGQVTSAVYSPSFARPIALAYVDPASAAPDGRAAIEAQDTAPSPAEITELPFPPCHANGVRS